MKVLIMVLMVGLMGCEGVTVDNFVDNEEEVKRVDEVVEPVKCADYREVVELSQTTYQVYNNTCNTITNIVFDHKGELSKLTKVVDTYWNDDDLITITYNNKGFSYDDWTIGRATRNSAGTQLIKYKYINGDNFISKDYRPAHVVRYAYEGEPEFDKIMNDAGYEQVMIKVRDVVSAPVLK